MREHPGIALVQARGCEAFTFLGRNDAHRAALMAAGAHSIVIAALDRHTDQPAAQAWGCSAVASLAAAPENRAVLWPAADAVLTTSSNLLHFDIIRGGRINLSLQHSLLQFWWHCQGSVFS